MKVKKYQAASMPEVMKKVRAELGTQAVILQSKTVYSGGVLGLFKKKKIEVVAAVDPQAAVPEAPLKEAVPKTPVFSAPAGPDVSAEVKEMKKMIEELQRFSPAASAYPGIIAPVMHHLKSQGVSDELLTKLGTYLLEKWNTEKASVTEANIVEWAKKYLVYCLQQAKTTEALQAQYVYLLGPTGVGKTTTVAKLASKQVIEQNKKVAFVTTDTYRIAAIEQLKTYAGLLNAPMKVAYSKEDMTSFIQDYQSYDKVYVDTAGRNYRESQYVLDLKPLISSRRKESAHFLVLSAAAKEEDLHDIIQNFSAIELNGFIFTKLDETKTKGLLVNLVYTYKVGVSYVTNGQNVPDDLLKPSAETIINYLFEDFSR